MVRNVTDRNARGLNSKAQGEINQILAQFTGPRTRLLEAVGGIMEMTTTWAVENVGQAAGDVGLRVNLQVDSFFGDVSQLIVEADGSLVGSLAGVATVSGNFPLRIPIGATDTLRLVISIPTVDMIGRQGSVAGFNWWVSENIVRDLRTDQNVGGDSRGEIRDWFRIDPVTTSFVVSGNPGWAVRQVTFG